MAPKTMAFVKDSVIPEISRSIVRRKVQTGYFFFLSFTFGRFINSQRGRLVRFSFIKASSPYVLDFNRCLDVIVKALGFAVYFKLETFGFRPEFLFQHCFTCFWNDIKKAIVSPIVSLALSISN